jgi:hypothetical protein
MSRQFLLRGAVVIWALCLVAVIAVEARSITGREVPDWTGLTSLPVISLATGDERDLLQSGHRIVAIFVDPRCDVCMEKSRQILTVGHSLGAGETVTIVLSQLPEIADAVASVEYPRETVYGQVLNFL